MLDVMTVDVCSGGVVFLGREASSNSGVIEQQKLGLKGIYKEKREWIKPPFNCINWVVRLSVFLLTKQRILLVCQKRENKKDKKREDSFHTQCNCSINRKIHYQDIHFKLYPQSQ